MSAQAKPKSKRQFIFALYKKYKEDGNVISPKAISEKYGWSYETVKSYLREARILEKNPNAFKKAKNPGDPYQFSFPKWFNTFIMPHLSTIENNGKVVTYKLGKIHKKMIKFIEKNNNALILLPRGHLKTTIGSFYILYQLVMKKVKTAMIISASIDKARETFSMLKEHLLNNQDLIAAYGDIIDSDRKNDSQSCFLKSATVGQDMASLTCCTLLSKRVTGTHPNIVLVDDIQEEPLNQTTMKRLKYAFDRKLRPAVGQGQLIIIGTYKGWDTDSDIYLWLESKMAGNNPLYPKMSAPAIIENDLPKWEDCQVVRNKKGQIMEVAFYDLNLRNRYHALWPQAWDIKKLLLKRAEMADNGQDDAFWSEYMLRPADPHGRYFPIDRLKIIEHGEAIEQARVADNTGTPIYGWVDPGGATGHGYALAVATKIGPNYYIFDMDVVRASPDTCARRMEELSNRWGFSTWGWEANFKQASEGQLLNNYVAKSLNIRTLANKGEKIRRIQTGWNTILGFEGEPTVFVNKNSKGFTQFMKEYRSFPEMDDGRVANNTSHEFDLLDAIESLVRHLILQKKKYIGSLSF